MTAGCLCIAKRLPLKIRAGNIVKKELEAHPKPAPVTLHEMLAEPVFVSSKVIQPTIEAVVIDALRCDASDIFKGSSRAPLFGHAKL
jgi:hypothetical protein